jgi:outer membrane protein assembly factor BamB
MQGSLAPAPRAKHFRPGRLNIFRKVSSVKRVPSRCRYFLDFHLILVAAYCLLALNRLNAQSSGSNSIGAVSARDWPEFRGPDGQGISNARNVPVNWSSSSNIVWRAEIPGRGWSSPVLRRGRLYVTSAVMPAENGNPSLRALCLDAGNGKILWDTEVFVHTGSTYIHNKNSHASPTPLVEGDRLYVHFGHQGTACLDLDGKVLWRNTSLKYSPIHGSGGSPILVDEALIFSCDGASDPFVAALNKKTGQVRWKTARSFNAKKKFSFSTPLLINVNGRSQMVSPSSGAVYAYDPKDGRELWRVRYPEGYSVVPRPVFGHGLLFISTAFDSPEVIAIRPDGQGDVTDTHVVWRLAKGAPKTPSMLLVGDELYFVSDGGIATCVDARSGRVNWAERVGGNYSASPLLADGRIYLQNEEGIGVVLSPGKKFEQLARNSLGERTLASYAVTDGALFIRTEAHLYCVSNVNKR